MNMNQSDIEGAASAKHACPNVRKGVNLLLKLMLYCNANTDGWAYCYSVVGKSCDKLIALLESAGTADGFSRRPLHYGTRGKISDADLKKAIAPIRKMAKVQKEKQAKYGNKFDFDVDAALKDQEEPSSLTDDNPTMTEAIAAVLWDVLPIDPEHEDRRQTAVGTKTKLGLRRTLASIIEKR